MTRRRIVRWVAVALAVAVVGLVVVVNRFIEAGPAHDATQAGAEAARRVPVVLTEARPMAFEDRVVISGSVSAKRFALVSARIPGTLDAVYVDKGDRVEAGETRLFQTDALKLEQAVAIAREGVRVSESSLRESQARLDQAHADLEQAQSDLKRFEELVEHHAVSRQQHEQQQSRCKQCIAAVKHAEATIALSQAKLEQAKLNLTIAEKDLTDSLVISPLSGRVSMRMKEPGEMAAAGTPVLKIEDLSLLEVTVFLPEAYYAGVQPGRTQMGIDVGGIDLGLRPVDDKSPTVDAKLRTFEVKGLVEDPPDGVVPGCLAKVTIVVDSRPGVGVPSSAVVTRGGRSVVFTATDATARMLAVRTGRDLDGWTEVLEGVAAGTPVVSMGQTLVDEGTPVTIVEEGRR